VCANPVNGLEIYLQIYFRILPSIGVGSIIISAPCFSTHLAYQSHTSTPTVCAAADLPARMSTVASPIIKQFCDATPTFFLKGAFFYIFLFAVLLWTELVAWKLVKDA